MSFTIIQARTHKIGHGLDYNKEHHLLSCTAFVLERLVFCDALTQHMQHSFSQEYKDISQAAGPLQMAYVLGRTEPPH
jgi:hypothetical protein